MPRCYCSRGAETTPRRAAFPRRLPQTRAARPAARVDPPRHPRHHARRRRHARRRARLQRHRQNGAALRVRIHRRASDAAVAHVDADRPLSRRPRAARERAVPLAEAAAARRAAARGRLPHRGVRLRVRAGAALRPGARLRCLRRRGAGAAQRALRARHDGPRARVSIEVIATDIPLGALLRAALSVRAAGAVPQPLRRKSLPRRNSNDGRAARPPRGCVSAALRRERGEGRGEHGEQQHGNLMYQSTMHVPLLVAGPGVPSGTTDAPVSTRRIFHTILGWARIDATNSLAGADNEVVAGEAMKPFLDYGWQPQVMAVDGRTKAILAGRVEVSDVVADPQERHDLSASANLSRAARVTLRNYPVPSVDAAASAEPPNVSDEERRRLASLGYVAASSKPLVRAAAPRPADMTGLFAVEDEAAALFVREEYAKAVPLLVRLLKEDPHNLDAALRLGTCYSMLGRDADALAAYEQAQRIAPQSQDVRQYLGLHYARGPEWQKAVPLLEGVVAESPDRVAALEGLAAVREKQGRFDDAVPPCRAVERSPRPTPAQLVHLGELAMRAGNTPVAIDAFERAHSDHDLELGVLYLAARRYDDARTALDRVPPSDPNYPMALFKRAQVSVLLREPDAPARIEAARAHANPLTRELIARERLFR